MKETIDKYINIIKNNKYVKKVIEYLKKNFFAILLFLIYPIILSTLLKIIFEVGFWENVKEIINIMSSFSLSTIFDDFKFLWVIIDTIELRLEYIIILSFQLLLYGITGKKGKSLIIITMFSFFITSINRFVYQLRGVPITIFDFLAIKTAINVVTGYSIKITITYVCSLIAIIILIKSILVINKKEEKVKNIFIKITLCFVGVFLFVLVLNNDVYKNINIWNLKENYISDGQILTLVKTIDNSIVEKPDDYSKDKAEEILNMYEEQNMLAKENNYLSSYTTNPENNEELPNIIVIMNESFCDLKDTYGLEMEENLTFFKSLEQNTVRGNIYVPALGGKTASTEWEFLTGNSSAFLPYGSIPYIQYINNKKESLISILNNYDYETVGFHSYKMSGYNRKKVYQNFDFKKSFFYENMSDIETLYEDYPTDRSTYNNYFKFINDNKNKKNFGFIVTMQNHSPYNLKEQKLINYTGDKNIDEYLSLINQSDIALKELVEKLENTSEKTILLFFGDHQPSFIIENEDLFKEKYWMQNYKIPYIIWANYDIEEQKDLELSSNYLSVLLADISNIPKTPYLQFLSEIKKYIPIITINGYKGIDGNIYKIEDEKSPYYELIYKYNVVQYYQMFDKVLE